jgi:hypothetical protein
LLLLGGEGVLLFGGTGASHLLGRHSITWATPTVLFCTEVFQDRVSWTIWPGWLQTMIRLISASWVAGITGLSHSCLAPPDLTVGQASHSGEKNSSKHRYKGWKHQLYRTSSKSLGKLGHFQTSALNKPKEPDSVVS